MMDKSHLPPELVAKQKSKGTYDSPCMSVCNYGGKDLVCQTCSMKKSEKALWKTTSDPHIKKHLLQAILKRRGQK